MTKGAQGARERRLDGTRRRAKESRTKTTRAGYGNTETAEASREK